jgi:hypothetical protein
MTDDKIVEMMARGILCGLVGADTWDHPEMTDKAKATYLRQATAALAALEKEGYAVVPVEPTEAMVDNAVDAGWTGPVGKLTISRVWQAMLAASSPKE